ncbi:MAG: hypothetical protein IKE22_01275, partial [Atopobiaceae bacterium]|nr:hypothetical protein [Atopobiaceae bacterium]
RKITYLKDDYPLGHPDRDDKTIVSIEDYKRVRDPYVLWPPERPLSFPVLMWAADTMKNDAPDGKTVAESRNTFIEHELPRIVSGLIEDASQR